MLRHDNISQHGKTISPADGFEGRLEQARGLGALQVRKPMMTAKREEVEVAALLITMESARHDREGYRGVERRAVMAGSGGLPRLQNRETWGTPMRIGDAAFCRLFLGLRHTESASPTAAPSLEA